MSTILFFLKNCEMQPNICIKPCMCVALFDEEINKEYHNRRRNIICEIHCDSGKNDWSEYKEINCNK